MEKIKLIFAATLCLIIAGSCEYVGFDGYINQLDEIGINSELADAVSFRQHLTSRPREFQGNVYVLGTRGVFEMDADHLSDYTFYAYSQDLGYREDYWQDELPPISCYRDPSSGYVIINSQNYNNGLKYGDTLTLVSASKTAQYTPASSLSYKFVAHITQGGTKNYVMTYWGEPVTNEIFWDSTNDHYPGAGTQAALFTDPELILAESIQNTNDVTQLRFVTQTGVLSQGMSAAQFSVYQLESIFDWSSAVLSGVTVTTSEQIYHGYWWSSCFSQELYVNANNRYLLAWGRDLDDGETMVIYDYITGAEKVNTQIPGNNMFPELGESDMTVFMSSIRGGVAKYVYD